MSASGITGILPSNVAAVESFGDRDDATLFPEEERTILRAVDERQREFATARHCARLALRQLGHPPVAIPTGERRDPIWPDGYVGSLTHCMGYRAAAVARNEDLASVGIDAEPNAPLPTDVPRLVILPSERAMLDTLPDHGTSWDRLLFSAKEAVYKAWFPLTGSWLGFHDAELTLDPDGSFDVTFLVPGPTVSGTRLDRLHGAWTRVGEILLTATSAPVSRF